MSDRLTRVRPRTGPGPGIAWYGLRTRADMLTEYRRHYRGELERAQAALSIPDEELVVETYRGVWVQRDIREVTDTPLPTKLYDPVITVCSRCLRACCWQGEYMCDEARYANIVPRRISTLIRRHGQEEIEHPDWWNRDLRTGNRPVLTVEDLRRHGLTEPELLELDPEEKTA